MKRAAFHINEVLKMMDKAKDDHATIRLRAWTTDGRTVNYDGWLQPQARCILCPTFLFMNF